MKKFWNNLKESIPLILFIGLFTVGFYFVFFLGIANVIGELDGKSKFGAEKSDENRSLSVYKPGIFIINSLKHAKYKDSIQSIYVNPHEKNKIMIMIKPNYWGTLSEKEKDEISREVLKKWKEIYDKTEYSEFFKAEVHFANS